MPGKVTAVSRKNRKQKNNVYVVINLITEYGCPLNGCKYAVASKMDESRLKNDYADELADYEPYIYMTEDMYQPISESRRNDEKWKKRYANNENPIGYVDGITVGRKVSGIESAKDPVEILVGKEELKTKQEYIRELRRALGQLSEVQRSRLLRKYGNLKTYQQIADEDGVLRSSVEWSVRHSLMKLRKILQECAES